MIQLFVSESGSPKQGGGNGFVKQMIMTLLDREKIKRHENKSLTTPDRQKEKSKVAPVEKENFPIEKTNAKDFFGREITMDEEGCIPQGNVIPILVMQSTHPRLHSSIWQDLAMQ